MTRVYLPTGIALALALLPLWEPPIAAQPPTKGQSQLSGGSARFGAVYTLENKINLEILAARYTVEPQCGTIDAAPSVDEKLFEFDFAIKNADAADNGFESNGLFTVVDAAGNLYTSGHLCQDTKGKETSSGILLKPGQGIGQPGTHDGLHMVWSLPLKARIAKIMVNMGRLNAKPAEKVVRYYIAGATKEEAGEAGDPKNSVSPLPANVADTSDKSGATALAVGTGLMGKPLPSSIFDLTLNSVTATNETLMGNPPDDGKKYVVFNVSIKLLTDRGCPMTDVLADNMGWEITDTDGEQYKPIGYRKVNADEGPAHDFQRGDSYTFRVVFSLPKAAQAKQIAVGLGGRKWTITDAAIK